MKDLLVVVPSRGRPANMERLWDSFEATRKADTILMAGLDADDTTAQAYPSGPVYLIQDGMQRHVTGWMNYMALANAGGYRAIGNLGDDNVIHTPGWDVKVLEALEKTPFAFGDDQERNQRPAGQLPTHIFMRSEIVRKLGYFAPPAIWHMWVDLAWFAWGQATGITYLPDVIIEHRHFLEGKAAMDDSYVASRSLVPRDLEALHAYIARRLNRDLARIDRHAKPMTEAGFYKLCWQHGLPVPGPG